MASHAGREAVIRPAGRTPWGGCRLTAEIVLRTAPIGAWLRRRQLDVVRRHMREEGENLKELLETPSATRPVRS